MLHVASAQTRIVRTVSSVEAPNPLSQLSIDTSDRLLRQGSLDGEWGENVIGVHLSRRR